MLRKTLNILMMTVMLTAVLTGYAFALDKKELIILHTNDIHGRVFPFFDKKSQSYLGGTTNLATKIAELRKEYGADKVLLIDAGDMSQGTPVSNIFHGDPITDYMNHVKYDCSTFGNHEFDWDREQLERQVARRQFPMVCANLLDKKTKKPVSFAKPYIIVEKNGMKVGIIGLATPSTVRMCFPKNVETFIFADPVESINKYKAELNKQGVKVIGITSHNGYDEDKEIASKVSGINFIIGGHSHTFVNNPSETNGIPVCQSGCWGQNLGFAKLVVDADTGKLLSFEGKLIPIKSYDAGLHEKLMVYENKVRESMSVVLGEINADASHREYERKGSGTTGIGDVISDAMKEVTKADVFFINTHGLRASLSKGTLTRGDVFNVLPFDNSLMTYELKGKDLEKLIEYYIDRPSFTQVSGLTCEYDSKKPFNHRVSNLKINGKALDKNKTYKIGTIDFLFEVSKKDCPELKNAKNITYGQFLRDEFEGYLKNHKKITVPEEIRVKVINGNSPGERKRH